MFVRPKTVMKLATAASLLAAVPVTAQIDFYFTADADDTLRRGAAGTVISTLPTGNPRDVDGVGSSLFYTDFTTDKLYSVALPGGPPAELLNVATAVGGNPTVFSIVPDAIGSTLYFTESGTDVIYSFGVGSGTVSPLVNLVSSFGTGSYNPRGLAIDEAGGKIYWSDTTTDAVYRANLDGSAAEQIFDVRSLSGGANVNPTALAIDSAGGRLFIAEDTGDFIATTALDGSSASVLIDFDDANLFPNASGVFQTTWTLNDIEYFAGRLYVADGTNGVYSIDATTGGSFVAEFVNAPGTNLNVTGVAVVPEPATAALLGLAGLALAARRCTAR